MKHSQEEYWRPRFHAPPLRSHPDPPPTIHCSCYHWQSGRSLPNVDNLYALSKLLDVHMEDFLVAA